MTTIRSPGSVPPSPRYSVLAAIRQRFSLKPETDYEGTVRRVKEEAEFGGDNIWALVFAILIASVGLNVNSTAVIIGAMLISPLMGPIVGAGFGLATNDFQLMRRGIRNLLIATGVALVTSAFYFSVSPLEGEQSEMLARTRPTLYDVLIALFGGAAGVVAVSRKISKGNVVPGVAIATALMPPLCTAGFGLAQGKWLFFLGAMHLFLINSLFICLATVAFVRFMHFERVAEMDATHLTRARIALTVVTLAIGIPSVYTGWRVVQEARFQQAARRFVAENLEFPDRALVGLELDYSGRGSMIRATLLGTPLPEDQIEAIEQRLPIYGLGRARLVLRQPADGQASPEQISRMVREGILDDLYKRNEEALEAREARIRVLEDEVVRLRSSEYPVRTLAGEIAALYPSLVSIGIGREVPVAEAVPDSVERLVAVTSWKKPPPRADQERLRAFLALRLGVDSVRLVTTAAP